MSFFKTVIANDVRNILRDRLYVWIFLLYPAMIIVISRFLVPWIADNMFAGLTGLYPLIFMLMANVIATIFGFITAFLIMDERDENLLTVLRVMPISRSQYLLYRMTLMTAFAFFWAAIFPWLTGLITVDFFTYLPIAFMFTLIVPIVALLVNVLASNKVQGFAMMKMLGGVWMLPLLAFFLHGTAEPLRYIFGMFPNFWTYMSLDKLLTNGFHDPLHIGIGIAISFGAIIVLFKIFNKRF